MEWITVEDLWDFTLIARTMFCVAFSSDIQLISAIHLNVFFNTHDCKLFLNVWKLVEIIIYNFVFQLNSIQPYIYE